MTSLAPPAATERARQVVAVAFVVNGLAYASWISRLPAVRDALDLSPAQLGLLLLCLSSGAVLSLPLSGTVIARVGPSRSVLGGATVVAAGLLLVALGVSTGSVLLSGLGLLLNGIGTATWDVAMNVEGADVEHRLGRVLMPRFHAGFSLGTVTGALLGAACAALSVAVSAQLVLTAALLVGLMAWAVRSFLPPVEPAAEHGRPRARTAWRERRTLLIGVAVLCFALVEGTANDWLTIALVDGHDESEAVGALAFGLFVAGMTAVRVVGGGLLARHGRPLVLRCGAVVAAAGLLLVVVADPLPLVLAGAVLWGAGAALGFPVGMSAAADDPVQAPVRVSVVSSIGYTAFLAGPPLIGFLAEQVGILRSLLVVLGALAVAAALVDATRPPIRELPRRARAGDGPAGRRRGPRGPRRRAR